MVKPLLIAFEGIDGSGKTTQITNCYHWLKSLGLSALMTREPTDGEYGKLIRAASRRLDPETEERLFELDRRQHVQRVIQPALDAGVIVLIDRYFYSSVAYQGTRSGVDRMQNVLQSNSFAPPADIVIYLDVSVDQALERIRRNRPNTDVFETQENLERVRRGYDWILGQHPCAHRIDASKSPKEIEALVIPSIYAGLRGVVHF